MGLPVPFPNKSALLDQRILIVEDSYFVAQELTEMLEHEGASVVGPVATLADAQRCMVATPALDAAVLDVNLRGEMIWPVADMLHDRDVKLVFATGYAPAMIKQRYGNVQVVAKPASARTVVRLLQDELGAANGR